MIDDLSLAEASSFALRVAIAGVSLCAAVLVAVRLLKRRPEPLRYGILFCGVIGLLAMPALVGIGQALPLVSAAAAKDEIIKVPMEMLPDLLSRPAELPPAQDESPRISTALLGDILLMLWTLGMALGLCRLSVGLWKQNRMLLGQPWRADFSTDVWQAELAQKLGLRRFPQVYLSPAAPMPMVVGILRPVIVLPEAAPAAWAKPQWEAVLLHEAAHIARRDPWAMLGQRVVAALFWWCPLVHLVNRRLDALREHICDDHALQGTCDRIAYAEVLVDAADRLLSLKAPTMSVGLLDSTRVGLEDRVIRLLEMERRPMTKLSLPGKLFGAGFLVAACLLILTSTAFSGGQAQTPKKIQIKIIVDGKEIDLSDPRLLEHIEAAQKKAKAGVTFRIFGAIPAAPAKPATPSTPATPGRVLKGLAFSPDGRLVLELSPVQAKSDPRIEELVKEAEKIKPGSGAEIRRALQGATKPASGGLHFQIDGAKAKPSVQPKGKILILQLKDGKVIQVQEPKDAKKAATPGVPLQFELQLSKDGVIELLRKKDTDKKSPPARTSAADLDSIRRQLERLSADLNELRKRLDAKKAK